MDVVRFTPARKRSVVFHAPGLAGRVYGWTPEEYVAAEKFAAAVWLRWKARRLDRAELSDRERVEISNAVWREAVRDWTVR